MLLWSAEDPPIPSGTILPVYIRSNIDHVWVVGIPQEYRRGGGRDSGMDKFEVPLAQLELVGGKRKAIQRAAEFSAYARTYAETLQDGLPIRDNPDNGSKRVYRLRAGEIVKVLSSVQGAPAISTSGDPLPGEWFRVLTENGSAGYCFSYRLRVFEHAGGALGELPRDAEEVPDPDLDELLSKVWSPESYSLMVTTRRIDLEELSRRWGFDPGQDTGIAQIRLPDLDRSFSYTAIRSTGSRSWRFEGARLEMSLQSNTTLAVHFTDDGGALRSLIFVALPSDVEDLMVQESARRDELFFNIYDRGPVYTSNNYGTLAFTMEGRFEWAGNYLLIPQIIPASALGSGRVSMGLFLSPSMESRYGGALTFHFDGAGGFGPRVHFLYTLDSQGFRLEYVPAANLEGVTVTRRSSSPTVIYFFRVESPAQEIRRETDSALPPVQAPPRSPDPDPDPGENREPLPWAEDFDEDWSVDEEALDLPGPEEL